MAVSVASFVVMMVEASDSASKPEVRAPDPRQTLRDAMDWLCAWPPDLFAVTWAVLQRTGAYRFTESLPDGAEWPPKAEWDPTLHRCALAWHEGLLDHDKPAIDPEMRSALTSFVDHAAEVTLEDLQHRSIANAASAEWKLVSALLTLHECADQICAAFGSTSVEPAGEHTPLQCQTRARVRVIASALLTTTGTLSRLPKHLVTVLPKLRTPQRGLSVRTLSHHLCVYAGEVTAIWRCVPFLGLREHSLNMMLVPHPTGFSAGRFKVVRNAELCRRSKSDGFFEYACEIALNVDELVEHVRVTEREIGPLDLIVLPELAIDEQELRQLRQSLMQHYEGKSRIPAVLSGLRSTGSTAVEDRQRQQDTSNELVFSFFFAGKWYESRQQKHHRWCLDEMQLRQYGLAGLLSSKRLWWEAFDVGRRNQSFLLAAPWLCIAPLICEDLAQQDPLADLVRSVGPQLVAALLMDGPQLSHRWPGRYASVLADDPGCAVLTMTSVGIATASDPRTDGFVPPEKVDIALWKDAQSGWKSVRHKRNEPLSYSALTMSASFREEFTSDGRSDCGVTPALALDQISQVMRPTGAGLKASFSATSTGGSATQTPPQSSAHVKLDLEELTRLVFTFDHMLQYGSDAATVASFAGSATTGSQDAHRLSKWFCRNTTAFGEVIALARSRRQKRDERLPQEIKSRRPVTLEMVMNIGAHYAQSLADHVGGDGSSSAGWAHLLERMRSELHDPAQHQAGLEERRAHWLVAELFHYLVRARLDLPRIYGHASTSQRQLLNEIEELQHHGSLVDMQTWTDIAGAGIGTP